MSAPLRLVAGTLFAGDYKVIRPLRTGGQGSIYVVEQLSTSKHRALKLMLPDLVANPTSRKRFELEAKIAARIKSDHVVESIASGVDAESGTPWLVMELLEGEDLASYVQGKKRLPPAEVLEIFSQLCHALGAAHEQGIVHRDLKPENVFLATPRRRGVPFMVKVLDFGIARILAEAQTHSAVTSVGLGTPMWMAPEQAVPGAAVSPATDVWPIGLVAFRLLTGHLFWKAPYDPGASVMMLLAEAFMHPMPTASERAEHYRVKDRLPAGFDAWFAKCVARASEERYANAAEAFAALEPVLLEAGKESSVRERPSPLGIVAPAPGASGVLPLERLLEEGAPRKADPAADTLDGAGERAPTSVGIGPEAPAPMLKTWGHAPELADEAVLSVPTSTPPPAPPVTVGKDRTSPAPAPDAASADEAPSVPTRSLPFARTQKIAAAALGLGVLLGGILVATQRSRPPPPRLPAPSLSIAASAATPDPPAQPVTTLAAPSSGAVDPPAASPSDEAPGEPSPGASGAATASGAVPAATGLRRARKHCKAAGAKCFGNDDCCDQTCRQWVCRENAALHDPYGTDGD